MRLSADSDRGDLISWMQWNDPNGSHTDTEAAAEDVDPYTLETAWDALGDMVAQSR